MVKKITVFVLASIAFISCQQDHEVKPYSYYHWKTEFALPQSEKKLITNSLSEKLYLRFFDIVYNEKQQNALPVATTQFTKDTTLPFNKVVPVIFIRNSVFTNASNVNLDQLARNTIQKIDRLLSKNFNNKIICEDIQIDCDWSQSTKTSFFSFLESLKKHSPDRLITSTVRLHQIKYREKTGVPPVDKVVLMAYNVGDISDSNQKNTIINNTITAKYLERLKTYPIKYNVALPVFEWGILYRHGKIIGLINQYNDQDIKANFNLISETTYIAKNETYIDGNFIYEGDKLRIETVPKKQLKELAVLIKEASVIDYETIFYHVSSPLILKFSEDDIKDLVK